MGMVVRREREIRGFVKTPFYRVIGSFEAPGKDGQPVPFEAEWKAVEGSRYFGTPCLYKDNGFRTGKRQRGWQRLTEANQLSQPLCSPSEKKKETKNPPLLYNLAELQNDCPKTFKSVRMRHLRWCRSCMRRRWSPTHRTDARGPIHGSVQRDSKEYRRP